MSSGQERPVDEQRPPAWLVVATVAAKAALLLVVVQVALDPGWGNLEGKAPTARAITYPLLAVVVPLWHLLRGRFRPDRRYAWGADLLVTLPGFSDLLGNRWDLYDRVSWFDDAVHLVNTGFLAAAVLLLVGLAGARLRWRLAVAIAVGTTLSLVWELWEFTAFVAKGAESATAYADTLGDLTLGWLGAVAAAVAVGAPRAPDPVGTTSDAGRGSAPRTR
ncbi:hypothetical protein IEQ44_04485 [Nocardioides sp. Y6]|uniref:DUF2238 domain-containing protein n=1 Tax=Nocardioides malaquae TaxID=2773426 RepID=A0ABR9RQS0_9ACTN|nr:hypothetical protein [Nocardioides malaquae]MBE7323906.1 hypothetical protein [Nocardioides malaquae]